MWMKIGSLSQFSYLCSIFISCLLHLSVFCFFFFAKFNGRMGDKQSHFSKASLFVSSFSSHEIGLFLLNTNWVLVDPVFVLIFKFQRIQMLYACFLFLARTEFIWLCSVVMPDCSSYILIFRAQSYYITQIYENWICWLQVFNYIFLLCCAALFLVVYITRQSQVVSPVKEIVKYLVEVVQVAS